MLRGVRMPPSLPRLTFDCLELSSGFFWVFSKYVPIVWKIIKKFQFDVQKEISWKTTFFTLTAPVFLIVRTVYPRWKCDVTSYKKEPHNAEWFLFRFSSHSWCEINRVGGSKAPSLQYYYVTGFESYRRIFGVLWYRLKLYGQGGR